MPGGVHVAGHHVTADAVAEAQGTLEVHRRAVGQLAQCGPVERLRHHVGDEPLACHGRDGQARAIDRDALADLEVRERRARHDLDPA